MKVYNKLTKVFLTILISLFLISSSSASNLVGHTNIEKDIIAIASEAESFSTLATALKEANLVEFLKSEGPFTVFAPTDDAFSKLPEGTLENLLTNKEALVEILKYHVVNGNFSSEDVAQYKSAKTLSNDVFSIESKDNSMFVNNARIISADVKASNGVIHIIDTVLIPESK